MSNEEFLKAAVTTFWERYGGKTYEGLRPKLAIYAAGVEEAATEVRPTLERILAELGVPSSSILLNVGDSKYTRDEDKQYPGTDKKSYAAAQRAIQKEEEQFFSQNELQHLLNISGRE